MLSDVKIVNLGVGWVRKDGENAYWALLFHIQKLQTFEPTVNKSCGKLTIEGDATTTKKCMKIEKFREISLDQFIKVKMCNRFMANWCIKKDRVQKLRWILRILCLLFTVFCEQFSGQKV